MKFKDFWKLGSYINRVAVMYDEEELYVGTGRKLPVRQLAEYTVDSFTVERGLLTINVYKEGE